MALKHTPGPWRVDFKERVHRTGSPACTDWCAKQPPVRTYHQSSEEAAKSGWPEKTEMHVHMTNIVEDIMSGESEHVVCFGHDYDDYGGVNAEDARLIAAAPELLDALKELVAEMSEYGTHLSNAALRQKRVDSARAAIRKAEGQE